MPVISTIGFPDFVEITYLCKEKIKKQFPKYGNSWMNHNGLKFWKKRIDGEIEEIFLAESVEDYKKEIIDAINVLSFMYNNTDEWTFSEKFRMEFKRGLHNMNSESRNE